MTQKLTREEEELVDEFRVALFGHGIRCRFCDWQLTEHLRGTDKDQQAEATRAKKGFSFSLENCPGYVPNDLTEWREEDAKVPEQERKAVAEGMGLTEDLDIC